MKGCALVLSEILVSNLELRELLYSHNEISVFTLLFNNVIEHNTQLLVSTNSGLRF